MIDAGLHCRRRTNGRAHVGASRLCPAADGRTRKYSDRSAWLGVLLAGLTLASPAHSEDISDMGIIQRLSSDIEKLAHSNRQPSYSTIPNPKSLAICVDWDGFLYQDGHLTYNLAVPGVDVSTPIRWYQTAAGYPTVAAAHERALELCRPHERPMGARSPACRCETFEDNEAIIYHTSSAVLARLAKEKGEEEHYTVILDDVEERQQARLPNVPRDIQPGLGKDLRVLPIGCEHDYECSCHRPFRNDLIPVTDGAGIAERLRQVESNGLYDCREESTLLPDAIFPYSRKVCHFVAWDRNKHELTGLMIEPMREKTFDAVLYEAAVPVDHDLDPADEPVEGKRVVYARSGNSEYLGVVRQATFPGSYCGVSYPFIGKAFSVEHCGNPVKCGNAAITRLSSAISKRFTADPFAAEPVPAGFLIPGELSFQRKRKPSVLLGGAFRELSSYNVNWWQADGGTSSGFPDQETFRGVSDKGSDIFVRITSMTMVATGNGAKYADPEPSQQDRYDEAIRETYHAALLESCKELSGSMVGDVCNVERQP